MRTDDEVCCVLSALKGRRKMVMCANLKGIVYLKIIIFVIIYSFFCEKLEKISEFFYATKVDEYSAKLKKEQKSIKPS